MKNILFGLTIMMCGFCTTAWSGQSQPLPDLQVLNFTYWSAETVEPSIGKQIGYRLAINNNGQKAAEGPFTVEVKYDGKPLSRLTFPKGFHLDPNNNYFLEKMSSAKFMNDGNHTLTAVIDCYNQVKEVNEQNNKKQIIINVLKEERYGLYSNTQNGNTGYYFIFRGQLHCVGDLTYDHRYRDAVIDSWGYTKEEAVPISNQDFWSLPYGYDAFIRPGTYLLKDYAGQLYVREDRSYRKITPQAAEVIYGRDWQDRLVVGANTISFFPLLKPDVELT
jgi:hypothetical protein